jgi:hypothetical protein
MLKYLMIPVMLLTLGFSSAMAADDDPTGKATSVEGNVVTLAVTGEMPAWAKKGGYVRTTNAEGKVILRGGKIANIEGNVITVNTAKAKDMVVGEVYTLARGKAAAGC